MTKKETTQTLKSDPAPKSKRLCNVSVREPKSQTKKEPEAPQQKEEQQSRAYCPQKGRKLPVKEQSSAATENNESSS
ncbi:hypothetical protein KXV73_002039, partial [Aspergillus fumigatus]